MFIHGDISSLLGGIGCLLAGAAIGHFLARQFSVTKLPPPPAPSSVVNYPSQPVDVTRLPVLLRELQGKIGSDSTVQQELDEIVRLAELQAAGWERILRDARIDSLTGLWNRRALDEQVPLQMSQSQRYGTALSVVIVDIDHFKQLNDQYGHIVGDAALQHIAQLLQKSLRNSDFVARYGGEEFVMLLPHTNLAAAMIATERIRKVISDSCCRVEGREISVKVSMGIAQVRRSDEFRDVFARADAALSQAKQAGRNQIRAEPDNGPETAPS